MSLTKVYSVFCDSCGDWTGEELTGPAARSQARLRGWVATGGGWDKCPACAILAPDSDTAGEARP